MSRLVRITSLRQRHARRDHVRREIRNHRTRAGHRSFLEELETRWLLTSVISVVPLSNSVDSPLDSVVSVVIDEALNPASISTNTLIVSGMQSGSRIELADAISVQGDTISLVPSKPFHPGELVQVSTTNVIASVDGSSAAPWVWQFRAKTTGGTGVFGDTRQQLGNSASRDLALGDLDGDGDLDAFGVNLDRFPGDSLGITNNGNRVWLNDGTGQIRRQRSAARAVQRFQRRGR